jgi:hypothetical protein
MLNLDEDAVICDLAETYQVYDWRSLPLHLVATFVCGLGQNSRIKRKLSNEEYTTEELLLMNISDCLSLLVWQNTKDGQKGKNMPKLFTEMLNEKKEATLTFDTPEEFEARRKALLRSGENG